MVDPARTGKKPQQLQQTIRLCTLVVVSVVAVVAVLFLARQGQAQSPSALLGDGIDEYLHNQYGKTATPPTFAVFAKMSGVSNL